MSKSMKAVLAIMLGIIIIYLCVCFFENDDIGINIDNSKVSGDESGEAIVINEREINYEITSGEQDITIIAYASGDITKTKYVFEDGKLAQIVVTEELETPEIAQIIYDGIQNDTLLNQIYNSIELNDNVITMTLKNEYVEAFAGMSMEEVYDNQMDAIEEAKSK